MDAILGSIEIESRSRNSTRQNLLHGRIGEQADGETDLTTNPYQVPAGSDLSAERTESSASPEPLSDREEKAVSAGLRWCGFGYRVATVSLIADLGRRLLFPNATQSANQLLHLLAGIGLVAVLVGLVRLGTIRGRLRTLTLLALAVGVFSATLFTPYLLALDTGSFVSGLFHLFGGTAFAMLLTAQALTALVVRGWATRIGDGQSLHLSHLAVLGFAICGVCNSAIALSQATIGNEAMVKMLGWMSGLVALAALLLCIELTRKRWRTFGK